jgi:LacI family transcriptional regulator
LASITINEVAQAAGVSIKTVSRVLNREPYVRQETRERVLKAVERLRYTPNAAARALAGSRSYLIGLFFDNPSPGYVSQIEFGAMSCCRNTGYHLLVEQLDGAATDVRRRVEALRQTVRMDGVILTPPVCDRPEVLDVLDALSVPYVRIAPATDPDRAPRVFMDDRLAACKMTAQLHALGHRKIAFISGPPTHLAAARREEGFRAAMGIADIPIRPEWVRTGDFSFRSGMEQGQALLAGPERPTAIFAGNDDMALGVMTVAHRERLAIPDAFSLVGFDDSPSAEVVWPQLTTVRQPVARMAFAAAEMLIERRVHDADAPIALKVDFEIVTRNSTAPVAA